MERNTRTARGDAVSALKLSTWPDCDCFSSVSQVGRMYVAETGLVACESSIAIEIRISWKENRWGCSGTAAERVTVAEGASQIVQRRAVKAEFPADKHLNCSP